MSTLGDRLREERERLGLSQAAFGAIGGVKKLAQLNYEKDIRQPPMAYIDSLRASEDIDVGYILSGLRDNEERRWLTSEKLVNTIIALSLNVNFDSFSAAVDCAYKQEELNSSDIFSIDSCKEDFLAVQSLVDIAIDSSQRIIDFDLLEAVIVRFEALIIDLNLKITPEKKASAITMLYRSFKATGKVDQKAIKDTIKLAST